MHRWLVVQGKDVLLAGHYGRKGAIKLFNGAPLSARYYGGNQAHPDLWAQFDPEFSRRGTVRLLFMNEMAFRLVDPVWCNGKKLVPRCPEFEPRSSQVVFLSGEEINSQC